MAAMIEASGLAKHYPAARDIRQLLRGKRRTVRAVDGIDLKLDRGESVGLVGESGSGKTTVGRLLLKLTPPSSGRISFEGEPLDRMDKSRTRHFRQQAQLVFQNPYDALNPRFSVRRSLSEPLTNTGVPRADHEELIAECVRLVQLDDAPRYLDSLPHQLSGGQLQRVVLARALVVKPVFLVADEPVSMLDVSVRAGILNLLRDLKARLGLTTLYISHDLTLVRYVCKRTLVMYLGKLVEDGPTNDVVNRPAHPYTQALIKAVPRPDVGQSRERLPISGAIGDSSNPLSGCRLRDRCPHAFGLCATLEPKLVEVAPGHRSACHLHTRPGG